MEFSFGKNQLEKSVGKNQFGKISWKKSVGKKSVSDNTMRFSNAAPQCTLVTTSNGVRPWLFTIYKKNPEISVGM